ncbi:PEP-CTERM sorting domain-containing protein [Eleftheria terrae]|uniref:PEP-CTERM sorting domain-containing protein n=1 Tax=Eleftheria terrae TaxID=1597781 RepID=UPI00263B61DE|nr:PEP-CTERM sorting domain-containing protein [Eleftheria terrae]WKB51325.1 PEP-CTERM sorting domain-containing protein [Eleftheria terrae]
MTRRSSSLALGAILALAASASVAVPLAPQDYRYVELPGTPGAARAGQLLEDETVRFDYAHFKDAQHQDLPMGGTIRSQVVRAADGTVDFLWHITTDTNASGSDDIFRLSNFYDARYSYNVDYLADGPGSVAPHHVLMLGEETAAWETTLWGRERKPGDMDFFFASELSEGRSSYVFFIDTNATSYARVATMSLNPAEAFMAGSGDYAVFAPVPEPASLALTAVGLGWLGISASRRQRRR